MKCEICQTADAEQAIRRKVQGQEDQELYVCLGCAAAETMGASALKPKKKQGKPGALPKLMDMILDATLEIMNHALPSQEAVCPRCGTTCTEYRKVSRLGCATCYETFAEELAGLIADMHRHPQHTGKTPGHPGPAQEGT